MTSATSLPFSSATSFVMLAASASTPTAQQQRARRAQANLFIAASFAKRRLGGERRGPWGRPRVRRPSALREMQHAPEERMALTSASVGEDFPPRTACGT